MMGTSEEAVLDPFVGIGSLASLREAAQASVNQTPQPRTSERSMKRSKKNKRRKRTIGSALVTVFLTLIIVGGLGAGGFMVWSGTQATAEEEMPLPDSADNNVPDAPLSSVGQDPSESFPVRNSDRLGGDRAWSDPKYAEDVTSMSVNDMDPMSVFVPSAGIYSVIRGSDSFVDSRYRGFDTLAVPDNPHRTVWYADGAPITGGDTGTTLLASHISHGRTMRGAFYEMHTVQPGAIIWTKDADGNTEQWKVTRLWYIDHKSFPQEYFAADGERQLVLTTCGGRKNEQGYYRQNVFLVAVPVTVTTP